MPTPSYERACEAELQLGIARIFIAEANVRQAAASEQQEVGDARDSQRTQDLIAAANQRADAAEERADRADLQLASMAAALRVPHIQVTSVFESGEPLPEPALPHTQPGQLHPASVAARLQHESAATASGFSTDSGSWEAASRADSFDSNWESGAPLGAPQGSWNWFGSRDSIGSGGMPSSLRPVDDAVVAERRANKEVWPQPGSNDRPGALSPAAATTAYRRVSGSDHSGLPPPARRPSSAGSDAVRRASFGRAAHQYQMQAQRDHLPPFAGDDEV
jgi:hypothetical protein